MAPGGCTIKLFTVISFIISEIVPGKPFRDSLMFAGKARSLF
jgi:hypothetical protein